MHAHALKEKVEGSEQNSPCACRQPQQERKLDGERTSLPIPGPARYKLQRKFAKCFFTDVQECKPT